MLDAAQEALDFARGASRTTLKKDRKLVLALTKELEILGEAASKVSVEVRSEFIQIPWDAVIGTRNRLIHGYFDVDLEIVWSTISKDLPSFVKELKKILASENPQKTKK